VIPDFMIQGGGLEPGLQSRATLFPPIVNEGATSGLSNLRGTIAMARTNDPDSATSQFFINTVDNTFLDATSSKAGYAVFGKVIEGMDVVDQIEAVPTHTVGSYEDVPVDDVMIESIRVAVEN
jgi:cyclophilin family peptidyl-prolyl cis-trans isomerase